MDRTFTCEACNYSTNSHGTFYNHCKSRRHLMNMTNKSIEDVKTLDEYSCHTCGKRFSFNGSLNKHMSICNGANRDARECKLCGRVFSSVSGKYRHIKTCSGTLKSDIEPSQQNIASNNSTNGSSNTNQNISGLHNTTTTTITSSYNNTTTTNNMGDVIIVNHFGKESLDYMTSEERLKCMIRAFKTGLDGFFDLIKDTYFNANHVENQTILLFFKTSSKCVCHTTEWTYRDTDACIDEILTNTCERYLDVIDYYETMGEDVGKCTPRYKEYKRNLQTFMNTVGFATKYDFAIPEDISSPSEHDIKVKHNKLRKKLIDTIFYLTKQNGTKNPLKRT